MQKQSNQRQCKLIVAGREGARSPFPHRDRFCSVFKLQEVSHGRSLLVKLALHFDKKAFLIANRAWSKNF